MKCLHKVDGVLAKSYQILSGNAWYPALDNERLNLSSPRKRRQIPSFQTTECSSGKKNAEKPVCAVCLLVCF